jgi:molecular chaperone DnaK
LKAAHEKLTHASHKLAEVLYKANAAQPSTPADVASAGAPTDGAKKEGEVIDAEYVDVDDKK